MADVIAFLGTVDFALAVGIALLGGLVHGYTGFGGALVTMPLFAVLYGPINALALSAIPWVVGSAQLLPRASRDTDWRAMRTILIPAAIAAPFGTLLLFLMDPEFVRRAIGGFVLLSAVTLATGWAYRGPRGVVPGIVAGGLCGGITGFAGVGGPPAVVYLMAWPDPPTIQRANIVVINSLVATLAFLGVAIGGAYDLTLTVAAILLAVIYVTGTWAGGAAFRVAPETFFRKIAIVILFGSGITAVIL